jgi:hypothetical protein
VDILIDLELDRSARLGGETHSWLNLEKVMLLLQLMKLAPSIVFTDCYFFILFQQCKPRLHFRCQCNTGHRGQCSNALVDSVDRQLGLCLFCAIGSECNCECCNCYSFPPGTSCLDASRANHQWHDQCNTTQLAHVHLLVLFEQRAQSCRTILICASLAPW